MIFTIRIYRLTPIDKMAYVPQFCHSMRKELQELKLHKMNPDGCFLSLGPTTDDCSCQITLSGEEARLLFDVGDEAVHVAFLPISYLVNIYERVISKLEAHRA